MVVQTRVCDGHRIEVRTYRNIIKQRGLAELREGFYAQEFNQWGLMLELKGDKRRPLGTFGRVPADEINKQRGTGIVSKLRKPEEIPNE